MNWKMLVHMSLLQGGVGRVRPLPDLGGAVRRGHDLQLPQDRADPLRQPAPRPPADQPRQDDHGHHEVDSPR